MMGVKARGFRELDRKIVRLGKAFPKRTQREILAEAAEELLGEMKSLAPFLTGGLRRSLSIVEGDSELYVGPVRPGGSHAYYLEFGTIHMTAQPFILPAYDNTEGVMINMIGRGIVARIDEIRNG